MPEDQSKPPVQPPPTIPPPSSMPEHEVRMWNMLCHLSALVGWLIPFVGNILGPFAVWQMKRNEIPSVDVHGKMALNFQITVSIILLPACGISFLLGHIFCFGWITSPLVVLLGIGALICTVIAGVKANNGEDYKYPFSFELVK